MCLTTYFSQKKKKKVDHKYFLINLTTVLFENLYENVKDRVHLASLVVMVQFGGTY